MQVLQKLLDIKGTLMQILKFTNIFVFLLKNNMKEVSHYNAAYFLTYTHLRCMKCLFTNIQKQ